MAKPILNYWIDVLMLLSFIITSVTALILFFFLPSGVRAGSYQMFLGIIKHNWVSIHIWSGIIFMIFVAVHFILHWYWMAKITKRILKLKDKANISR